VSDRIVLLAGPGEPTFLVANYLTARYPNVAVIIEEPVPRVTLARRRARRLGWVEVAGQVAFVTAALPLLRRSSRARAAEILAGARLSNRPVTDVHAVASVNGPETAVLLGELDPTVVVVNGTRIISDAILRGIACPVINIHAGITPRYRGVHGGYWAMAEGRPELVGTTVHLVDAGIDTGGVLARAYFTPEAADSIATYPYRHLADGLPLLAAQIDKVLGGEELVEAEPLSDDGPSQLRWHPTIWGYLGGRRRGVR
jgi:folate-dependent phosphoribosylglycinamide formyltransferase PurN